MTSKTVTPDNLPGFTGELSASRFPMYGQHGAGPFRVSIETRRKEVGYEGMRSEGPQVTVSEHKTLRAADRKADELNSRVVAWLAMVAPKGGAA